MSLTQHMQVSSSRALGVAFRKSLAGTRLAAPTPRRSAFSRCHAAPVEANLFSRIARIGKAYADQIVSSAEDPEKILEQAVQDMQGDLIKLRQAAAEVTASQKRLEKQYETAQQAADEWYRRAELALTNGEEELAREALSRKKTNQDNANLLKGQLDAQIKAVDQIITNMRTLEGKLAEAKMKKDTLKARAQSAKSAAALNDMMSGLSTDSALGAFEKMEEKVMALEAQAEAATALSAPSDIESKFLALEGGSGVDDELLKMKMQLAEKKPVAQLPEGRSTPTPHGTIDV